MIYVVAYFNSNLGDDLFVRTLVRRYPKEVFYVCETSKRLGVLIRENNLRYNNTIESLFFKIKNKFTGQTNEINKNMMIKADALVRIGGSVFMERPGWENKPFKYINTNIFYIGSNFGPYKTNNYKIEIDNRLQNINSCCFRDKYSFEMFRNTANVSYAPDILFGYPYYPKEKKGDYIGISVIDLKGRGELEKHLDIYEEGVVNLCEYYQSLGKQVLLLGFCEPEGDLNAIHRIINRIRKKHLISSVCYRGDIDKFLETINDCEKIYATRFHAMILGFAMRKMVIPIIYSGKQIHVLEDLNYEGIVWNLFKGEPVPKECYFDDYILDEKILFKCMKESQKQFLALDHFLK